MRRVNPHQYRVVHYRGYRIYPRKLEVGLKYQLKYANFWLPRTFTWTDPRNMSGLYEYINALIERRVPDSKVWEDSGTATDHHYESPPQDVPMIRVSPDRLRMILRGEDPLEIPANGEMVFTNEGGCGRYVPMRIMAALISDELEEMTFDAIEAKIRKGLPVIYTRKTPQRHNCLEANPAIHHTGVNLSGGTPSETAGPETAPAPVGELTVKELKYETHIDIVSLIQGQEDRPYFVRRLIAGGHSVWCGTSYSVDGPWTEYQSDHSRMLALGITPP